jgi:hypothetical protein
MTPRHDLTEYVNARVDRLTTASCNCLFTTALEAYHELNLTLQTLTEHDTTELQAAIKDMLESSVRLKDARDKAVQRFRQDGLIVIIRAQTPVVAQEQHASDSAVSVSSSAVE